MIESDLVTYLKSMLGTNCKSIEPITLPQGAQFPSLTYKRVSTPREVSHSGSSHLANPRFQFDCWGSDYLDAINLAKLLVESLHGVKFASAQASFIDNELDAYETDSKLYHVIVDVVLWTKE